MVIAFPDSHTDKQVRRAVQAVRAARMAGSINAVRDQRGVFVEVFEASSENSAILEKLVTNGLTGGKFVAAEAMPHGGARI